MSNPSNIRNNHNFELNLDCSELNKDLDKEVRFRRNSLSTDRLDMSFGEILSMYERDEIVIRPAFQRLFRWSDFQMSRFVESILLGIPIPPIFVAENEQGKWELVDGLQRVSSLLSFFGILKIKHDLRNKNFWSFDETDLVKNLKGFSSSTLPNKYLLNIKRATCRIEIIRWNSDYDMRYELFNRLNTGGSSLTDQEIRNCIYRGVSEDFNEKLEIYSLDPVLEFLVSPSQKQKDTLYLQELVLRFMSIFDSPHTFVNGSIGEHMTNYMREAVGSAFKSDVADMLSSTLRLIKPLGPEVFKLEGNNFSTSMFDAVTVGISKNFNFIEKLELSELEKKIIGLKTNKNFRALTGSSASGKTRVLQRVNLAVDYFSQCQDI